MVALTGIEWVTVQFTSVQLNLSCSFSVHLGPPDRQMLVCESLSCDRVVTARALSDRRIDAVTPLFLRPNSTPLQFRSAVDELGGH
jgi:hypothetical protein